MLCEGKMNNLKKLLIAVIIVFLFPLSCTQIARPIFKLAEQNRTVEIKDKIPDMFPVLVTWKDNQKFKTTTVYYKDIEAFTKKLNNYSYLVPEGQEESLNKALIQQSRSQQKPYNFDWESPNPWFARFKVLKHFSDGSQLLEVESTWDDDRKNIGWYKAYDRKIIPEKHLLYFGPGVAMVAFLPALLITIIVWAIGVFVVHLLNKRKK